MYATCLFCNKPLGSNESLETFPIGKRLAFDPAKGRLWVVCTSCERWNLTPLEERWEAIEQAEKLYSDTRRRVSTDNIGLAKMRDGTTLVRIGTPMRPEFAAWRYGDQFGRRRTRQMAIAGAGVVAMTGLVVGGAVAGVGIGGFGWLLSRAVTNIVSGAPETVVAKIKIEGGKVLHVRRRHLGESTIHRTDDGSMALHLRYKNGSADFVGREAERIAAIVIPKVNRFGGDKKAVAAAVQEIEADGGAEKFLDRLAQVSSVYTLPHVPNAPRKWRTGFGPSSAMKKGLFGLPASQRLALEMALHEETERRALEGELGELERAWRDAEEIAAISDNLFVPASVQGVIDKVRGHDDKP
ncbi:MAG: hypothetical protein ABJF01_01055 [bacterium]